MSLVADTHSRLANTKSISAEPFLRALQSVGLVRMNSALWIALGGGQNIKKKN